MKIAIFGYTGFVGQALLQHFSQPQFNQSIQLLAVGRASKKSLLPSNHLAHVEYVCLKQNPINVKELSHILANVDVVINTVGIINPTSLCSFNDVHVTFAQQLFDACVACNVKQVVQFSALNAQSQTTHYYRSKYQADVYLQLSGLPYTIVRPSLIFGSNGASTQLFCSLATLPLLCVPNKGQQTVQPIHINDICQFVSHCINNTITGVFELVGQAPITYTNMLQQYAKQMDCKPFGVVCIPNRLMLATSTCVDLIAKITPAIYQYIPLSQANLKMLNQGSSSNLAHFYKVMGFNPIPIQQFLCVDGAGNNLKNSAVLLWAKPLLQLSLAIVWLYTAIICGWGYPFNLSIGLLQQAGITNLGLAKVLFWGSVGLDTFLGLATLVKSSKSLWLLQIALVLFYSVFIAFKLPQFWLHPFGAIIKNIPIIALLSVLYVLERKS